MTALSAAAAAMASMHLRATAAAPLGVLGSSLLSRLGAAAGTPLACGVTARPFSAEAMRDSAQQQQQQQQQQQPDLSGGLKPSMPAVPSFASGHVAPHAGIQKDVVEPGMLPESYMHHPVYSWEYLETVTPRHLEPKKLHQHVGLAAVRAMRWSFDKATGYGPNMTEAKWLQRMVFLETVAGVPGMVAGMLRHLKSLRSMKRDNGWIHTLLEEAENERMHLLTFFELRKPGPLFRAMVILTQGIFFNAYFISYLVSPKACHAFVGFLEEEAVKTYTHALADIDAGKLWPLKPAPPIAIEYWRLPANATMRDLILAVRADEACHAHVNHSFSALGQDEHNPFAQGASQLP